jgi:hypothetical protein
MLKKELRVFCLLKCRRTKRSIVPIAMFPLLGHFYVEQFSYIGPNLTLLEHEVLSWTIISHNEWSSFIWVFIDDL